jgi:predicted regulator of Ras-like GTPase activity (Roadblock/LC7/MglB family)
MDKENKLKDSNEESRFQAAVNYLVGYNGVIGAVIGDNEGLTVACSPQVLPEGDLYSVTGLEIMKTMDKNISRLMDPGCGYVSIKTGQRWLTVATARDLYLVVLADRKADDLLNVRIQRTLEMITNHIKENYPAEIFSTRPAALKRENTMEATHV